MRVEDVYVQNRRLWVRLHEKGGKRHEMPCHHNLEAYLHAYIDSCGLDGEPKAPLWQAVIPTLGGAFVIYTIYKNVVHVPSPYSYFGWLVLIWLLIGLAIVAFVPGLARRVRIGLAQSSAP